MMGLIVVLSHPATASVPELAVVEAPVTVANAEVANSLADGTVTAEWTGEERLPQVEFGLAVAAFQVPAYPSSGVTNDRVFFAPWFVYRSDSVQVKDGGVELVAYESDRLKVDLGIGGSLNSDTSDTPLREEMPDLDFLLELGPRFDVVLSDLTNDGLRSRLNWITSLRMAISTDFRRVDYRGPVLNTELAYRMEGFYSDKLSFRASISSTWLGNELMDYFFSVEDEFATPNRPAFNASGGFLKLGASVGVGFEVTPAINTYLGFGYSSFAGTENESSPLFENDSTGRVFLAASWRLYKSKKLVSVWEE